MSIEVGASLIPGTANTPLDARCRVTQISDIPNISNPFLGMEFFCIATSKTYKVTKLKSKMIGSMSVANGAVDDYEEIPDAVAFAALEKRVENLENADPEGGNGGAAGTGMLTVANTEELSTVENAKVGQHIYIADPGKEIIVTGLTEGSISATEDVPTRTDITNLEKRVEDLENADPEGGSGENTDNAATSISTLMLTKPANGLFLIIRKAGSDGTRANSTIVIDTLNVAADRQKVKGYLDSVEDGYWTNCPEDGFSTPYDGGGIAVDLSFLTDLPCTLFYTWATDTETFADWQSITFPCCGGAGKDSWEGGSGGGTGSDRMALFCLCTEEPPKIFDGLIWVKGGTSDPQYVTVNGPANVVVKDSGIYDNLADGTIIIDLSESN